MTTMEDHAIIGRRDRGILTPAGLKGKRIGVSMGTTTQFFLDAFLNRQRLAPGDVTVVNLAPRELAEALAVGEIDAAVMYQPFLDTSATALADQAVVFSGDAVYDVLFAIAATRDYVAARQKTLEKILRATIRGARFCKDTPGAAIEALAAIMKTDPAIVKRIWPSYQFEVSLRQGLLLTLEDEARWAIKNKLTAATKVPNYLDALALEPLQAVAPSAVTVVH
jgi:NitT/TauT family transport system substrate-binding protein